MSRWWPRTRARGANTASGTPHFVKVDLGTQGPPGDRISRQELGTDSGAVQQEEPPTLFSADVEALIRRAGEDLGFKDQSWEKGLAQEAKDAEGHLPADALLALEKDAPPTPEMELAFLEEAMVAEEPPEPAEEPLAPAVPDTTADQSWQVEFAMVGSPSPETGDIVHGVLPPRPSRLVSAFPQDAAEATTAVPVSPPTGSADALAWGWSAGEGKESSATSARQRLAELERQIDSLHDRLSMEVRGRRGNAKWCFQELARARDLLQRYELAGMPQAVNHVQQVETYVKQAEDSRIGAKKYGWRIAGWGLLWGTILVMALSMLHLGWFGSHLGLAGSGQAPGATAGTAAVKVGILLQAMLWGGVGSVAAIWYNLLRHVSRRDFDRQYNLSYLGKPFFGLALGGMVYMVAQFVTLLLGVLSVLQTGAPGRGVALSIAPWAVYVLAWICGFKEAWLLGLMDRTARCVFSEHTPKADLQNPPPVV